VAFPCPEGAGLGKPVAPLHRRLASRQLVKDEALAELEKLKSGIWPPYRRALATERKGFSDIDVAAAGGWSDTRALKVAYQQADAKSKLSVVNAGT
jgi:hypothetical protein